MDIEEFKLLVTNLPADYEDLTSLFIVYEPPIYIYRHPSDDKYTWAFVIYSTRKAAEMAIRVLNRTPPLYLKVQFADTIQNEFENDNDQHVSSFRDSNKVYPNSHFSGGKHVGQVLQNGQKGEYYVEIPDIDEAQLPYSIKESSYKLLHTGRRNAVDQVQDTGTDLLVLRKPEYTHKQCYIIREKLEKLLYGQANKIFDETNSGNCLVCHSITSSYCKQCDGWYCSRECQVKDWSRHKSICRPASRSSHPESTNDVKNEHLTNNVAQHNSYYKGKDTFKDENHGEGQNRTGKGMKQANAANLKYFNNRENEKTKDGNKVVPKVKKSVNERLKIKPKPPKNKAWKDSSEVVQNSNTQISSASETCSPADYALHILSVRMFKKVKVTVPIGPMEYWVQLLDSEEAMLNIMDTLNIRPESSILKIPEEGAICAAQYEDLWYRGRITSVKPVLKVFYIDFGNEECCSPDKLRAIPKTVENVPPLAVKIRLADGTSAKYDSLKEDEVLCVKSVSEDKYNCYIVHVEGESYDKKQYVPEIVSSGNSMEREITMPKLVQKLPQSRSTPSVVFGLQRGTEGVCQFRQWLNGGDFGVTILYPEMKDKFDKLFTTLLDVFRKESSNSEQYIPKVGETVAAFVQVGNLQEDNTWMRARVLAVGKDNFRINFCDMGQLATVKRVFKLPEELANFPEFGARCSMISEVNPCVENWFKEKRRFKFIVTDMDKRQNTATCLLYADADENNVTEEFKKIVAVLKPWIPTLEVKQLDSSKRQNIPLINMVKQLDSSKKQDMPLINMVKQLDSSKKQDMPLINMEPKSVPSIYKKPGVVSVNNNDLVVISIFNNQNSLCLRPVKELMRVRIGVAVNNFCNLPTFMNRMPEKDEIVGSWFNKCQKRYYRARVLDVDEQRKMARLYFIDYGSTEMVTTKGIKPLPSHLADVPAMAVEVRLKGIRDGPISNEARKLILNLVANKVEMKLVIPGPIEDGVELILPSGKNLNEDIREYVCSVQEVPKDLRPVEKLEELPKQNRSKADKMKLPAKVTRETKIFTVEKLEELPNQNRSEADKMKLPAKVARETKIFTEVDIKYLTLEVGKTVELIVLHKLDSVTFMACAVNNEAVIYTLGDMLENMNKYCESLDEKSYVPAMTEVCFAKFEDKQWYRGLCINDDSLQEDNILFMDFGNVACVDKSNIRKMTEEYMRTPAIAVQCMLDDSKLSATQRKQVDDLVETNKIYEANVVSCDDRNYVVELPHVSKALSSV